MALDIVRSCLPESWGCRVEPEVRRDGVALDAVVTLEAPDGSSTMLVVEAKRLVAMRDVPDQLAQLRSQIERAGLAEAAPMLVARYLPPSTRGRLESEGVAYADATGNLRVMLDRPSLFIRNVGEDRDPWRGPGRPRGTLKGAPVARVVRALADFQPSLHRARARPARRCLDGCDLPGRGVEAVPEALRTLDEDSYLLTGSLAAARTPEQRLHLVEELARLRAATKTVKPAGG